MEASFRFSGSICYCRHEFRRGKVKKLLEVGEFLGKVDLEGAQNQKIVENRKKEDDLFSTFPGLVDETIDELPIESPDFIFYLWELETTLFKIYKTVRQYLQEGYAIDSSILLALIHDSDLNLTKTLNDIPYVHSGYVKTVASREQSSGEQRTEFTD